MAIILQSANTDLWTLGLDIYGRLTTTPFPSALPAQGLTILHLTDSSGQTWLVGVETSFPDRLTTNPISFDSVAPIFILLPIPFGSGGNVGMVTVRTDGRLQTQVGGVTTWIQNGLGAGADNSIAGGGGGFMALPQPPSPSGAFNPPNTGGSFDLGNSWNGRFGPASQTLTSGGTWSVISNPGRSA